MRMLIQKNRFETVEQGRTFASQCKVRLGLVSWGNVT